MTTSFCSVYAIRAPKYWLVRDEFRDKTYTNRKEIVPRKDLFFHLSHGDYILTLVTILRFFEESLINDKSESDEKTKIFKLHAMRGVINDLLYISDHYTLKPNDKDIEK